jgi:unsaturated rhamnogalacturonyl hydrolase
MRSTQNIKNLLLLSMVNTFLVACQPEEKATETTQRHYSEWMARSEMQRNPEVWTIDFLEKPKWDYTQGLICLAIQKVGEQSGNQEFFDYTRKYADFMIDENGAIKTYKKSDFNIDRVNGGKFLFGLYKQSGEEKFKIAIEDLRDQMREHPRTNEGGFWHKKIYPYQMWLDGIYMASPFLAEYAIEFNEPELFDDIALQFELIDKHTYNPEKGLNYHGFDESREQAWADKETGLSPHFWGRAMGWYSMALVDVLDFFPVDHPKRALFLELIEKTATGILRYQDPETGLWYQVLDQGTREMNYLEASVSSMFAYFLLKAVDKGYLSAEYSPAGKKAYQGILTHFIRENADGSISLTEVCAVAGLGGNPYRDASFEYYVNEPRRDDDPKGVGPFILASIYFEKLNP